MGSQSEKVFKEVKSKTGGLKSENTKYQQQRQQRREKINDIIKLHVAICIFRSYIVAAAAAVATIAQS